MTLGPIEPSMTGNSKDLPVALSVNVTVPAGATTLVLSPSMGAPLSFRPAVASAGAVAGSGAENRPTRPDYQTPFGSCNAISRVRELSPLRRRSRQIGRALCRERG